MADRPNVVPASASATAASAYNKPRKSPPLAFERTPNDSLQPLIPWPPSPSVSGAAVMTRRASPSSGSHELQLLVDQQAAALDLVHGAFATERQAWTREREHLYQRIASLERLLKSGDHFSPAKSPALSPSAGTTKFTSPPPRSAPTSSASLPPIVEDERPESLARRRSAAPTSIEMPVPVHGRRSSVTFTDGSLSGQQVEEVPRSPSTGNVSPPPLSFRREAGSTPPLHAIRPPTPPPQNSLRVDGIADTPTRHNTHINTLLTKSSPDEQEDRELTGPLNMPELPSQPAETNFTFEMLARKLELIEKHPDDSCSMPLVFASPSPGLAVRGEDGDDYISHKPLSRESPLGPVSTRTGESLAASGSDLSSSARSPGAALLSPGGTPLSPSVARSLDVQANHFEQGGIKLKKRTSVNFGAPFGQLGGRPARRFS